MALTPDDLLAISQLLDVKLKAEIQPIKNELQAVKTEIQSVKAELRAEIQAVKAELHAEIQAVRSELQAQMQEMQAQIQELRAQMQEMQAQIQEMQAQIQELQAESLQMKLFQENVMMPRLRTIEACYLSTYEKYKNSAEGYEALQADNELMKQVIMEHSAQLQKLA